MNAGTTPGDGVRERVATAVERAVRDLPDGAVPGSVTISQITGPSSAILVAVAVAGG